MSKETLLNSSSSSNSNTHIINISDLPQASVLAALYNAATPFIELPKEMYPGKSISPEKAVEMLRTRFDYLENSRQAWEWIPNLGDRRLQINLSADTMDCREYNKLNGAGAAQAAISALRQAHNPNKPERYFHIADILAVTTGCWSAVESIQRTDPEGNTQEASTAIADLTRHLFQDKKTSNPSLYRDEVMAAIRKQFPGLPAALPAEIWNAKAQDFDALFIKWAKQQALDTKKGEWLAVSRITAPALPPSSLHSSRTDQPLQNSSLTFG